MLFRSVTMLKEIDEILTNEFTIAFDWFAPAERLVYWNKFGMPKSVLAKTGDYRDAPSLWWYDPEKQDALNKAQESDAGLAVGETIVDHWQVLKED